MDISYLLWLQSIREALGPAVEMFMGIISAIGVHTLIIFIPAAMYWCFNKKDGQFVFFTFSFGTFLNGFFKLSVCCYRPWIRDARIIPSQYAIKGATGYSFPSGHSTVAGSLFVSAGWKLRHHFKRIITIIACVFAALVMFSRNYLGVHTPQDVVFGMLLGIFSIWVTTIFFKWIDKNEKKDLVTFIVCIVSIILALVYYKFKSYPLDYVNGELLVDPNKMMIDSLSDAGRFAGVITGWLLERRLIKFTNDCKVLEKIVRFVIGAAVILLVNYLLVPALVTAFGGLTGNFMKGFIQLFTLVFVIPCTFKPLSKLFKNRK